MAEQQCRNNFGIGGKGVALGHGAGPQTAQPRKVKPHPVTACATIPPLASDLFELDLAPRRSGPDQMTFAASSRKITVAGLRIRVGQGSRDLLERALLRRLIRTPTHQLRPMAKPVTGAMVEP
jgi:hypothetical protein